MENKQPEKNTPDHPGQADWKRIKGIGDTIARALYDLGLRRYSDLAGYTPEKLAALLQEKVSFVNTQRIERDDWIGQARALATANRESARPEAGLRVDAEDIPMAATQLAPNTHHPRADKNANGWHELADFFVSFGEVTGPGGEKQQKTRVHYSQADRLMEWDGIAATELVRWMITEASLPTRPPPKEGKPGAQPAETQPDVPESLLGQLAINHLWVSQVDLAPHARGMGGRMVRVEARLIYTLGEGELPSTPGPAVSVDIYLVNSETSHSIFFENPPLPLAGETHAQEIAYDIPVPPPGRYQLYLLARQAASKKAVTLQQGPVLKVV